MLLLHVTVTCYRLLFLLFKCTMLNCWSDLTFSHIPCTLLYCRASVLPPDSDVYLMQKCSIGICRSSKTIAEQIGSVSLSQLVRQSPWLWFCNTLWETCPCLHICVGGGIFRGRNVLPKIGEWIFQGEKWPTLMIDRTVDTKVKLNWSEEAGEDQLLRVASEAAMGGKC